MMRLPNSFKLNSLIDCDFPTKESTPKISFQATKPTNGGNKHSINLPCGHIGTLLVKDSATGVSLRVIDNELPPPTDYITSGIFWTSTRKLSIQQKLTQPKGC